MTLTISLTDVVQAKLEKRAKAIDWSVEKMATHLLDEALEDSFPALEEVVERIRNLPPGPVIEPTSRISLAQALRAAPEDPDFDLSVWQVQWQAAETEIAAMTQANDISEGRA